MIESVAGTFQISSAPWPFWKMKTTIPYAAPSEMRFRMTAFSGRRIERNARISRTYVSTITNSSTHWKLP